MNYFSSSVLAALSVCSVATSQIPINLTESGLPVVSIDDVVIADFDADGDGDVAVAFQTPAAGWVCVLYNNPPTGLASPLAANTPSFVLLPATSAAPIELFAGSVTAGSTGLLAYGDPGGAPYLQVLTNPGGPTSAWLSTPAGVLPVVSDLEASDRDGDGDLDLIGLIPGAASDTLQVYVNTGGVFAPGVTATVAAGSLGGVGLLAIGSLDGNGSDDDVLIYTANAANPGQIQTMVDNTLGAYGPGAFVSGPIYPGIPAISAILLDELTGDSLDDAVLYLGGFNAYLPNITDPALSPSVPPTQFIPGSLFLNANSGVGPGVLAAGDIDGDGDRDILDGNASAGTLQINLGGGVFAGSSGPLPAPVSAVATGAIDGNSIDDIAVGFSPGSTVLILVN